MKTINNFIKYIPYLYFISIIIIWFVQFNESNGIWAYPILLLGIPFIWQVLKPSRYLNFLLGIMFVCISSYILALFAITNFQFIKFPDIGNYMLFYALILIPTNFMMALWIIRNSLRESF